MTPEEWKAVREAFEALLELPAQKRRAALRNLPDASPSLRREVARLVQLHQESGEFLERPLTRLMPDGDGPVLPRLGDRVGAYRLVREIARGGMGLVFAAERADDLYEKQVAVKFLSAGAMTEDDRDRFAHERRILARLDHPAVARIIDGGSTPDGRPYLIMELVDGRPLTRYCREEESGLEDRLTMYAEICRGIQAAHRIGVVHGDVKPANVVVNLRGEPRIVDFGTAVGAREPRPSEQLALTPQYASPEQRRGAPPTTASDVYSLGMLLFELTAGRLPRQGENRAPERVSQAIVSGPVAIRTGRTLVARSLASVIAKATEVRPEDRYASAEELAREVERILAGEPPAAMENHPVQRLFAFAFRHRRRLVAAGALVIGLAVAWITITHSTRERAERARRFIADAQRIEHQSRVEALLPRHDVRPFRQRLRDRVRALQAELSGGWPAPVHYAIGVAELQLGEHGSARHHLEAAWQGGLRTAEVARSLMQALAWHYAEELRRAEHSREPEEVAQRRQEVIRRYRDRVAGLEPVLEKTDPADLLYARALADYLTGQPESARRRLRRFDLERTDPRTPRLEGNILVQRAMELRASEPARALELLERAASAYSRARTIWRSDLPLHVADCHRAVSQAWLELAAGDPALTLDATHELCAQGLEIHPGHPEIRTLQASLHLVAAQRDVHRGLDPGEHVGRVLEVGGGVRDHPQSVATARKWMGAALNIQARWLMLRGRDPTPALERSIQNFEESLRILPRDTGALNNLGNVWGLRFRYLEAQGRPSAATLERAIAAHEEALRTDPFAAVHVNLGVGYQKKAELALSAGGESGRWIEKARRQFDRALELAPGRGLFWERAAGPDLVLARRAIVEGNDPSRHLDEALRKLRRAVAVDPGCMDCRLTLAECLLLRARSSLDAGVDPGEAAEEARALLAPHAATARGETLLDEALRLRERAP